MGFFSNLPKLFIKSAVQQVGRDGGRVISNKVYGSAHSIPIRHIVNSSVSFDQGIEEVQLYDKKDSWLTPFGLIVCFIFSLIPICSFFGVLIGLINGIRFLLMKNKTMYKVEMESVNVPDRRYKMGYRIEYMPIHSKFKVIPSKEERKVFIKYGVLYLLIGIGVTFLSFYILDYLAGIVINK